jgi:hypothetical protein
MGTVNLTQNVQKLAKFGSLRSPLSSILNQAKLESEISLLRLVPSSIKLRAPSADRPFVNFSQA